MQCCGAVETHLTVRHLLNMSKQNTTLMLYSASPYLMDHTVYLHLWFVFFVNSKMCTVVSLGRVSVVCVCRDASQFPHAELSSGGFIRAVSWLDPIRTVQEVLSMKES